jgi:hypothetical protein
MDNRRERSAVLIDPPGSWLPKEYVSEPKDFEHTTAPKEVRGPI